MERTGIQDAIASDAEQYAKRHYDDAMLARLVTGILNHCGIWDAGLELLHGSSAEDVVRQSILAEAKHIGRAF